jgi:hypothetical protein
VAVALGLVFAVLRALRWASGEVTAETLGYAFGGALGSFVVALLIAVFKPVKHFLRFGLAFGSLSLLFFVTQGQISPAALKQHIADLAKEAAGTKSAENRSGVDAATRDLLRDILQERKEFDQQSAQFVPTLAKIYSLESFSSKEEMRRMRDAIRDSVALDVQFTRKLESIPEQAEARLNQMSVSDSDKAEMIKGIRQAYGESKVLNIRMQAMAAEKQWADATVGFYEFAMANAGKIKAEGSHLVIANEKLRQEFNARMKQSESLRDNVRKLNAELDAAQRETLEQAGITKKDLGLKDDAPTSNTPTSNK